MLPVRSTLTRSIRSTGVRLTQQPARICTFANARQISLQSRLANVRSRSTGRSTGEVNSVRTFSATPGRWQEAAASEPEFKVYEFNEFKELSDNPNPKRMIVDVREPNELKKSGVIPNSINVPLQTSPDAFFMTPDAFEDKFGSPMPDKDTELVFSCKAGIRSNAAARLAKEAGYAKVGSFEGSWLEWAKQTGAPTY